MCQNQVCWNNEILANMVCWSLCTWRCYLLYSQGEPFVPDWQWLGSLVAQAHAVRPATYTWYESVITWTCKSDLWCRRDIYNRPNIWILLIFFYGMVFKTCFLRIININKSIILKQPVRVPEDLNKCHFCLHQRKPTANAISKDNPLYFSFLCGYMGCNTRDISM